MAKNLRITQIKSVTGSPQTQRDTMSSSGLKKIRQSMAHPGNPAVRGQVRKVRHLATVEEID